MGHNGAAAPRVCVPANVVSAFIGLLCLIAENILCSEMNTIWTCSVKITCYFGVIWLVVDNLAFGN